MGEASNMLCLLDRPNHLALEHPTGGRVFGKSKRKADKDKFCNTSRGWEGGLFNCFEIDWRNSLRWQMVVCARGMKLPPPRDCRHRRWSASRSCDFSDDHL